jgi:hypothetical protein
LTCFLGIFRSRCKAAVRLLNPSDATRNAIYIYKRGSSGRSKWRYSVPNTNGLHHLCGIINNSVSHA